MRREWRQAWLWAAVLVLTSWLLVRAGISAGELWLPAGQGHSAAPDLFRFDSVYYKTIAEEGYSYNGDPASSPNIVFAPLFPLLVAPFAALGLDPVMSGFVLNKLLLFWAVALLYMSLSPWLGPTRTRLTLLALVTSAGSYSFHAFYSESAFLFALALTLFALQENKNVTASLGAGLIGASRLTGLPISLVTGLLLGGRAWRSSKRARVIGFGAALLSLAGSALYLGYIWWAFGNPFVLLPEIQSVSWGRFHPETDWAALLSGEYLFDYWAAAFEKGGMTFVDIQTLNLFWTTAGLASGIYLVWAWGRHILTSLFLPYLLFIYATNTSSEFLISAHRFFAVMLPIFLMGGALASWAGRKGGKSAAAAVAGLLLLLNAAYGCLHTAAFNQGVWFWF